MSHKIKESLLVLFVLNSGIIKTEELCKEEKLYIHDRWGEMYVRSIIINMTGNVFCSKRNSMHAH